MNAESPQWAIVELMGHIRYGGQVSKDVMLGTSMLRVYVPQLDGSFVSQLVNPASIYRITFCAEAIAREAASIGDFKPMSQWEVRHLLPRSTRCIEIKPTEYDSEDNLDDREEEP